MNVEKLQTPNSKLQRSSKSQAPKARRAIRILLIILACGLLCVVTLVVWPQPRNQEPEYEGKKLSEWITFKWKSGAVEWPPTKNGFALQHMGAQAVPWMLRWLQEPTPREIKVDQFVSKFPPIIANHPLLCWSRITYSKQRADDVSVAFFLMGTAGKSAVPGLTRLALKKNRKAFHALLNLTPDNVPGLVVLIEHRDFPERAQALRAFGLNPAVVTNLQIAIPAARGCLNDADPKVAGIAAMLLLEWRVEPATAVPLLTGALRHPQAEARQTCADALASFGADALSAVPALTVCLKDSELSVRQAAWNAVFLIAPETVDWK